MNINIRTTADTSGATQAAASLDRIRESGESISQTSGVMDQIADSLSRVKTVAEETGAAMKDGMGAEYEQALENANSKLDQYADALTAAGSRMKAAFNDNPGLTGFIDEVTNAVLTSEEFRKKLEQVDDVFEVLNNKMSDLDLGAKWGDDLDENLQQIIDGYNKEMDAADKAAEKAEAAEARKQQAAAATVERLEANNRRASATYEELQAELESYIAKLEEARKAGDNVAQADALKNIQDLGRRIKTAGDAGQLTSTQVKGLAGQITIAATRILGMSSALRGAIPFIHLFGTTIKTAMGPLGWAMLLIQGLTAGITALIDHFKTKSDELERQAEEKKKNMEKLIQEANELKAQLNHEAILQTENDLTSKIASNRKIETEALRESVREQQRLIDLQSKILDEQDRARLLDAETDFYDGKYGNPNSSEARRKLERVQEGIRMDANARHRAESEEAASFNVRSAEEELAKAREAAEQLTSRVAAFENSGILSSKERTILDGQIGKKEQQIMENLLSVAKTARNATERSGGFTGLGRISSDDMRKWIKTLIENGGDTSRLDESWLQKGNAMFGRNFRSARQLMEEVLNAGNGRQQIAQLNELKNRRKRSDEALIDQGGDLSTDDSRKKAYKVHDEALTEARKKQVEAMDVQYAAEDNLEKATRALSDRRALNAAQERRDEAQQRNTEAKQKNAVKKEEEDRIQKLAEVQMREQQEQLKKKNPGTGKERKRTGTTI
ncbi:hypothetical protein DMI72_04655 [Akkermansia muciniphila]|nr:hypothetical protein DMI71_04585 [Akkermansia muciniphila]QHV55553.1 hypothetical protein DMI72_04655 [Akkermansia muciniphila]QHV57926.1 hypothetical protein DMI73_04610 [Akkermansia muciniphila]QHV61291.1 hypothetical protein DMI74_10295 [Akkermansia muciniphila]